MFGILHFDLDLDLPLSRWEWRWFDRRGGRFVPAATYSFTPPDRTLRTPTHYSDDGLRLKSTEKLLTLNSFRGGAHISVYVLLGIRNTCTI